MQSFLSNRYVQYLIVALLILANAYFILIIGPQLASMPMISGVFSLLTTFATGLFLAYIFNFAVVGIEKRVKNRTLAIIIFFFIILALLGSTLWLIIPKLTEVIPDLYSKFVELMKWFTETDFAKQNNIKISTSDINKYFSAQDILSTILNSTSLILSIFAIMFICLFEYQHIVQGIQSLAPKHFLNKYERPVTELNNRMSKFVTEYGKLLFVLFIEHFVLTFLLGLNPLVAITVVLFYLIPVVGGFLYLFIIFLLAFSQSSHTLFLFFHIDASITYAFVVFGLMFLVFLWDSMFLMPKYIGDALKLSFLVVIFVTFLMSLLGWIGFILSNFVLVLIKFIYDQYVAERPQRKRAYDHESENAIDDMPNPEDLKFLSQYDMIVEEKRIVKKRK